MAKKGMTNDKLTVDSIFSKVDWSNHKSIPISSQLLKHFKILFNFVCAFYSDTTVIRYFPFSHNEIVCNASKFSLKYDVNLENKLFILNLWKNLELDGCAHKQR